MGRLPGRVRVGCRVWFRKKLWGGFELGLGFRLRVTELDLGLWFHLSKSDGEV